MVSFTLYGTCAGIHESSFSTPTPFTPWWSTSSSSLLNSMLTSLTDRFAPSFLQHPLPHRMLFCLTFCLSFCCFLYWIFIFINVFIIFCLMCASKMHYGFFCNFKRIFKLDIINFSEKYLLTCTLKNFSFFVCFACCFVNNFVLSKNTVITLSSAPERIAGGTTFFNKNGYFLD